MSPEDGETRQSSPIDWSWAAAAFPAASHPAAQAIPDAGLVLINTPLSATRLRHLWGMTRVHLCADGGANRLHVACPDLVPDVIVGDFDSATSEVLDSYRARGVDIRDLREDQDTTDLDKALHAAKEAGCAKVLVGGNFAGVDGRLDHTFGIMNTLHQNRDMPVVVVSDESWLCLLVEGEHTIFVPDVAASPHCGLVPVAGPCQAITTTGLVWNMEDARMEFGGLISTCNRIGPSNGGKVTIRTSSPVLWMCSS